VTGFLLHLECTLCGRGFDPGTLQNLCRDCARPLYPRYNLPAVAVRLRPADLERREASLWRYRELLPVDPEEPVVTLGEGWTPILRCPSLGEEMGLRRLLVKDEGQMPTGSFKPEDVPELNRIECAAAGARAYLVNGLITDCGQIVRAGCESQGWFDMSTLKEPYRVEGKKTMGFELAEQLGWRLPDVVVYPTGGGTGLVGMWKAFAELEALGWIDGRRPRMVAVQSEGCAPIARAFQEGTDFAAPWENASTCAAGIRVPAAVGDFLMLRALRESGGTCVTVTEAAIRQEIDAVAAREGLLLCPEGAAAVAGLRRLAGQGWVRPEDEVVVFNTGTGLKYPECRPADLPRLDRNAPIDYASL
jgi:threonine synthase